MYVVETRKHSRKKSIFCIGAGGFRAGILCCVILLAACGTPPPPKNPLNSIDSSQSPVALSPTATSSSHLQPIRVVSSETNTTGYATGQMKLTITTSPFAVCSFIVSYGKSSPSKNIGIEPHTANAQGVASWTWRVDDGAHTGVWPLSVSTILPGGAETSSTVSVTVTLPPVTIVASQTVLQAAPKGMMSLTLATASDAAGVLTLRYGPGSLAKSIHGSSNAKGVAYWSWRVDDAAPVGSWSESVVFTLADGEQTYTQFTIRVQ